MVDGVSCSCWLCGGVGIFPVQSKIMADTLGPERLVQCLRSLRATYILEGNPQVSFLLDSNLV